MKKATFWLGADEVDMTPAVTCSATASYATGILFTFLPSPQNDPPSRPTEEAAIIEQIRDLIEVCEYDSSDSYGGSTWVDKSRAAELIFDKFIKPRAEIKRRRLSKPQHYKRKKAKR